MLYYVSGVVKVIWLRLLFNQNLWDMKTFRQISQQCERIMSMYLKGYGTETMRERVESIFFKVYASV